MINSNNIADLFNFIRNQKKSSDLSLKITKNNIDVTKNKKNADVIKIVFNKKSILKFLTINIDNINETIKNKSKYFLFLKSDFIQFNFGPMAIANKNGIRKGIINLL